MEEAPPPPATVADLLQRPAAVVMQSDAPDQGMLRMAASKFPDDALTLDEMDSFTPDQRQFYLLVAGFRRRYNVHSWTTTRENLRSAREKSRPHPIVDAIYALTPQLHSCRTALHDVVQPDRTGLSPSDGIGVDLLHEGERWQREEAARQKQLALEERAKQKEDARKKKEKKAKDEKR